MDTVTDVPGFSIGHWTDDAVQTGCTVLLFDKLVRAACDVRGAAPGSRELALLGPGRAVQRADAIVLTGGSAFGLAAVDGVMQWLKEDGRGFPTPAGPVPIVPAAVIFDLSTGQAIAPTAAAGYEAASTATSLNETKFGRIGAGTGARFGAIGGPEATRPGGIAIAQIHLAEGTVTAVVVLNAFGEPSLPGTPDSRMLLIGQEMPPPMGESTTLMACISDIPLDHESLISQTIAMHDALARSIRPAHTIADGDIAFAVTVTDADTVSPALRLRASVAAELAVEAAIRIVSDPDFAKLDGTGDG